MKSVLVGDIEGTEVHVHVQCIRHSPTASLYKSSTP
jgi:hypothetical protein